MRNRVFAFTGVLLLALGVGLFLRWRRPADPAPAPEERREPLSATAPDPGTAASRPVQPPGTPSGLPGTPVPAGTLHVAGRVRTHLGIPAGKCRVRLRMWQDNSLLGVWDTRTDSEGSFRLDQVPELRGELLAGESFRDSDGVARVRVDLSNGRSVDDCEIRLPPCSVMTVNVVNSAGNPLAGAQVGIADPVSIDLNPDFVGEVTDEFGVARLKVYSRFPRIEVMKAPPDSRRYILPPAVTLTERDSEVEFVLEEAGIATGKVLTPHGHPWAGGRVATLRGKWPVSIAKTDPEGRFEASVPLGEAMTLAAYFDEAEPLVREPEETEPVRVVGELWDVRSGDHDLFLQLYPEVLDRQLRVRVESPTGDPVSNAQVRIFERPESPLSTRLTNDVGLVEVQKLPSRPLRIEVSPPAGDPAAVDWTKRTVDIAAETEDILFRLGPGFRLSGVILNPDGTPCAGAQVCTLIRRPDCDVVTVGADGRFSFLIDSEDVDALDLEAWFEADGRKLAGRLRLRDHSVRNVTVRLKEAE